MAYTYDSAKGKFSDTFKGIAGRDPNSGDYGDFDNLFRKSSDYSVDGGQGLDNPEGSFEDLMAGFTNTLTDRFKRPTASDGGIGGSADVDANGQLDYPGVSPYPRDGGQAKSNDQLDQLLKAIQGMNAQPDVDLSGIQPGDFPTFEVPGEDLSPAIDDTLMDLMGGADPLGLGSYIRDYLARTKGGGVNSEALNNRLEGARETLGNSEDAALADMRAVLGDRGLLGMPGAPEGAELDATTRTFEPLQRAYLAESRQAFNDASDHADQQELAALAQATGFNQDHLASRLAAANSGTERQKMMGDMALESLNQNMQWNQFLAEFGLKREQVAADIKAGKMQNVSLLLSLFQGLINSSRGGYVGD